MQACCSKEFAVSIEMGRAKKEKCNANLSEAESCVTVQELEDRSIYTKDPKKKYKCTEPGCDSIFLKPSRLARHMRRHTGERPFKCERAGCKKTYTNLSHLIRHRKTHSLTKQTYKCKECSLIISNEHNLKRHYKHVHEQRNKFCCKTCDLNFKKEHRLKEHEAMHAGIALYKCDRCNKQCTTLTIFKKHLKTHEIASKNYTCTVPECCEVFDKWSLLCRHMKNKHVTSYTCKDCSKVFLNKHHLKYHSVVHSNDRLIVACPYEKCPRFYFYKRNLDQHIRICHIGEKFHCDICDTKLSTKKKLIQHIQKIHQSKRKKRLPKKTERKKRKDAGVSRKSMLSKLTGLNAPAKVEKCLLRRKTRVTSNKESPIISENVSCDIDRVLRNVEVDLSTVLHCDIALCERSVTKTNTNLLSETNVSAHLS